MLHQGDAFCINACMHADQDPALPCVEPAAAGGNAKASAANAEARLAQVRAFAQQAQLELERKVQVRALRGGAWPGVQPDACMPICCHHCV